MTRSALVLMDGQPAGRLTEDDDGYEFRYLREWVERDNAFPVSLALPLRPEPFRSPHLHPFFENLLPEGWLLEISIAKLKISKDDAFGLLLVTCADCFGAVEVRAWPEMTP